MVGAIYKCKRGHQSFDGIPVLMHVWLSGLLIGTVLTDSVISKRTSVIFEVCKMCFTTPLKYLLVLLPFLFSAFAVIYSRPKLLLFICGIKAVYFSAGCMLLCYCFGQAGWLAYWLFMFCDACALPFLYWYWIRNLSAHHQGKRRDYVFLLPVLALIVIDYRIVLPYAMKFGFY